MPMQMLLPWILWHDCEQSGESVLCDCFVHHAGFGILVETVTLRQWPQV